jgi:hypothetical protein
MANQYGLPEEKLENIRARDKTCVYCHKKMVDTSSVNRRDWATIEHLNYLPPWNNPDTVAICCGSCNSSRGQKKLIDWFKGQYCLDRNINEKTIAEVVKNFIKTKKYNC